MAGTCQWFFVPARSLSSKCSANCSSTTASECFSKRAATSAGERLPGLDPNQAAPGRHLKGLDFAIVLDSRSLERGCDDLVDGLLRGPRAVDGHHGFVSLSFLEILELRA